MHFRHQIACKIDYFFEISGRHAHDKTDTRWHASEKPDMRNRNGELNMAHSLATDNGSGDFHSTLLTNNTFISNTAVFSTVTFEIVIRTENLLVKEAAFLAALGAVVDGFRLRHFTE